MPSHLLYESTSQTLLLGHKFEFAASKNGSQMLQVMNKENTIFQKNIFTFVKISNGCNDNAAIFARHSNLLQNLKMFIELSVVILKPTFPRLARAVVLAKAQQPSGTLPELFNWNQEHFINIRLNNIEKNIGCEGQCD